MRIDYPTDTEVRFALDEARKLATAGVPVFVATPALNEQGQWDPKGGHNGCGYWLPKWKNIIADPRVIDTWRPGWALGAVMGHKTDGLDVDPQNNGDTAYDDMVSHGQWPTSYGRTETPSGGTHDLIVPLRIGSHDAFVQGIDLKGGTLPDMNGDTHRGFLFLPPTIKASKTDDVCRAYKWMNPPDLGRLIENTMTDGSGHHITNVVINRSASVARRSATVSIGYGDSDPFFDSQHQNASRAFTLQQAWGYCSPYLGKLSRAPIGGINNELNIAAKVFSHFGEEFWSRYQAEQWLLDALQCTAYDPNGPRNWRAEDTIESAYSSRDRDWKAMFVPDQPIAGTAANNGQIVQQQPRRRVELTAASTIKPKRVHWLWDGRMPLGELTLLAGREGIGKSTVCYQLASDVTRGMLPGEFKGQCRPVVVIATEDSWEHTIVPRLMAAGANTDMVFRAEVVTSDNIITGLSLPADTEMLKSQINEIGAAMVLLDPLISRLDTKLDTHKDAEVRQALEPLVQLAHDCRVSVLGLIHVNKSGSTDPLNSVMGSKAFTAVARSVLYCITDPEDELEQRKLLGMPKNNLGRQDLPTLTFEIENTFVCDSDDGPIYSGRIKWGEELTRALRDVLETSQRGSEERTAVSEAAGWLEDYLKGCSDGCASKEAKKEGVKAGHSRSSVERAAKRLPIEIKSEGFPRQTWWRWIPEEDRGESDLPDSAGGDPFFLQSHH